MIRLTAHGAAREVTGSKHLLDTGLARILVDCGAFQGRREEAYRKNEWFPFDPSDVSASINTHGHLDHCGTYPLLVKRGFAGPIFSTPATRDIARVVLQDSARVMLADWQYVEKRQRRDPRPGRKAFPPLFDSDDVEAALARYTAVPYHRDFAVARDVTATLVDAGHILGSAAIDLRIDGGGDEGPLRVAFTGDLGRKNTPILKDPEPLPAPDYLVCESTYGERLHDDLAFAEEELAEVIRETVEKRGRVIIPAFAIGRVQEIVFHLHRLYESGRIPGIPVYVDSPMAVAATTVFKNHPECYDAETVSNFLDRRENPFSFSALTYVSSQLESKKLNDLDKPCIIVSSSGMCEGGRILHHLANGIGDARNTVLIVGFMGQNTLGRALADRQPIVRIFGEPYPVRARVKIINAFSAHADRNEIGEWVARLDRSRLKAVLLVHGEPAAQDRLKAHLLEMGVPAVEILEPGKSVGLETQGLVS